MIVLAAGRGALVGQLVDAVRALVARGELANGEQLWSIRQLARELQVSTFTVAEAYDRLVAEGVVSARRGEGFFAGARAPVRVHEPELPRQAADAFWLVDSLYEPPADAVCPGSGWLPPAWLDDGSLARALRQVARGAEPAQLGAYGDPRGTPKLREWLARELAGQGIAASPAQLLLTHGANQALTLAIAALTRPGDCVLVDDPGYCNLLIALQQAGVRVLGVPWTAQGPDTDALARLAAEHRPKAFFTNPRLHNPTGASYSMATLHRVLKLGELYDFWLVEDDVCAGLSRQGSPTLAALDGLHRVVYVGSLSKTLSPALRLGYVSAAPEVVDALTHHKMVSTLSSSELGERVALAALTDGQQRRRMARLQGQLACAREATLALCARVGLEVFAAGQEGMFVWARLPAGADGIALSASGVAEGVMLAPGAVFRPQQARCDYLRMNVAFSASARVEDFFRRHLA